MHRPLGLIHLPDIAPELQVYAHLSLTGMARPHAADKRLV